MSVRLEVHADVAAPVADVWEVLVDWAGQARWIPLTTVEITTPHRAGLGVHAVALSGFWLGRLPVGLLDNFVVTGWRPPRAGEAELEVLHRGPYFTGEGVFHLVERDGRTQVTCIEMVTVPGGRLTEPLVRLALPVMRAGFAVSLRRFAVIAEARARRRPSE